MQSFSTPVRVPDDVLPHRLDGHGHAVVLGTFHHRFQAADEALQGFLPVGGGIVLVFDVRRAGLCSDHPRAADLRDPHAAVVAFLHFRKLYRVRIRQVQIAPQHRDIQPLLLKARFTYIPRPSVRAHPSKTVPEITLAKARCTQEKPSSAAVRARASMVFISGPRAVFTSCSLIPICMFSSSPGCRNSGSPDLYCYSPKYRSAFL